MLTTLRYYQQLVTAWSKRTLAPIRRPLLFISFALFSGLLALICHEVDLQRVFIPPQINFVASMFWSGVGITFLCCAMFTYAPLRTRMRM